MKMAFECDSKRFYDDGTWICPTSDGGIADAGEWRREEGGEDAITVWKTEGWGKQVRWTLTAVAFPEIKAYFERLERQVAAIIVGGGTGGNY